MKYKIAKKVFAKEWEEINLKTGKKETLKSYTYKFFIKGKGYWISDSLVFNNLLDIEDDNLILKEPIEKYYSIEERENKNGTFNVVTINNGNYNTLVNKLKTEDNTTSISLEEFDKIQLPRKKAFLDRAKTEKVVKSYKKEYSEDSKFMFMKTLLEKISNKKIDQSSRHKLLNLISKELDNKNTISNDDVLKEIKEIKVLLNNKSDDVISITKNSKDLELVELSLKKDFNNIDIQKHDIKNTLIEILNFKMDNESGLKQLVHIADTKIELYQQLEKILKHIKRYYSNQIAFLFYNDLKKLIASFQEAIAINPNQHPFEHNLLYTEKAKEFKRNYRFGKKNDSEYTNLEEFIESIINDKNVKYTDTNNKINSFFKNENGSGKFDLDMIKFLPNLRTFNLISYFYTWTPSVKEGLKSTFQAILQHSNINGNTNFKYIDKRITIEIIKKDVLKGKIKELIIFDEFSVPDKDSNDLLDKLRSTSMHKTHFRSICNWIVEYDDIDGNPIRLNVLVDDKKDNTIESLENKVGGFKTILQFYTAL